MSVAGPSQSYPVPRTRNWTSYEEDLIRMITQLDHSDIESLWQVSHDTRIQQGHKLSDQEIAFGLLIQNARELAGIEADRAAAQRLALEEDGEPDPAPRVQPSNAPQNVTTKAKPKRRKRGKSHASPLSTPVSNDKAASSSGKGKAPVRVTMTRAPPRPTGHDCVICQDPIFEAEVQAPCGHFYDISCITDLFKSATRDESLYPPRCCRQTIPLPQVRQHLTQALLADFELKAQEFGTLKRIYCASPACSRFLGPLYEGLFFKVYTCPSSTCTTVTCGTCRAKYEEFNHRCASDNETERVLTLGQTFGWQRCPGCAQMIELDMGCYHMTCRCKTEFCYICCARWKTCTCPQWDENRLLTAAERRADAQLQHANRWQLVNNNHFRPLGPPAPTTGNARSQPVNPPQQEPAAAPPRLAPFAYYRPATLRAEVPVAAPPPPRTVANTEATVPAPHTPIRSWAEVAAQKAGNWNQQLVEGSRGYTDKASKRSANLANDWDGEEAYDWDEEEANDWGSFNEVNISRDRLVRDIMERLRVDHDCLHMTWKYRSGGGICDSCFEYLPNYLFQCGECETLGCNRCRLNRL